jgi:hypothetical protein
VNLSIPLCAKWCFSQGSIRLVDIRFCWHVPNSSKNKNLKSISIPKNGFFGPQNFAIPLEHMEFLNFFPILNLMILQTVWNECVRFDGHINIQVSYKIIRLEVPKKASILHSPTCFQVGLFWGSFGFNMAIDVYGLTLKIPCGFWTNLSSFGHNWRDHFFPKLKCKKWSK